MLLIENWLRFWLQRRVRRTEPTHEDDRRVLHAVVVGWFELVHIRYKQTCVLGNHHHPYRERWTLVQGDATASVMRIKPLAHLQRVNLRAGQKLVIAANEPHAIAAGEGTVLFIIKPARPYVANHFTVV